MPHCQGLGMRLALLDVCIRKDGGARRQDYFKSSREHCSASMRAISLDPYLTHQSMGVARNQAKTFQNAINFPC